MLAEVFCFRTYSYKPPETPPISVFLSFCCRDSVLDSDMLSRWSRAVANLTKLGLQQKAEAPKDLCSFYRNHSKVSAAATVTTDDSPVKVQSGRSEV